MKNKETNRGNCKRLHAHKDGFYRKQKIELDKDTTD